MQITGEEGIPVSRHQVSELRVNVRPLVGGKSGGQTQNVNNKDGFTCQ